VRAKLEQGGYLIALSEIHNEVIPRRKLLFCAFDAKTGMLCTKCETSLRLGHVTQADVDGLPNCRTGSRY
jgi:hypothetical protein